MIGRHDEDSGLRKMGWEAVGCATRGIEEMESEGVGMRTKACTSCERFCGRMFRWYCYKG